MDKVKYYEAQLDKELSKYPLLNKVEELTNVPKVYSFLGGVGLVLILTFFNIGGAVITSVLGWLFPSYFTFLALESKTKDDDIQWLTYWAVFGFFSVLEFASPVVLYLLPFYYFFKTLGIFWLALPHTRGAEQLYHSVLQPTFATLRSSIDELTANAVGIQKSSIQGAAHDLKTKAEVASNKLAAEAQNTVNEGSKVSDNIAEEINEATAGGAH